MNKSVCKQAKSECANIGFSEQNKSVCKQEDFHSEINFLCTRLLELK